MSSAVWPICEAARKASGQVRKEQRRPAVRTPGELGTSIHNEPSVIQNLGAEIERCLELEPVLISVSISFDSNAFLNLQVGDLNRV